MGEEGKFYSENMTMVVWNMDDYPIPAAAAGIEDDLGFIRTTIEEVGHRMGFHGPKEIDVYCKRINCDVEEELSKKAEIYYLPSCTKPYMAAGVNKVAPPPPPRDMTSFLVRSAVTVSGPYGPINFVVIAKAKPKGELDRVLKCLESRGHTILLIDPTAITGGSFFSVESLLGCARLLRPPPPTRIDLSSLLPDDYFSHGQEEVEEYLEYLEYPSLVGEEEVVEEDNFKIVNFLEPIRPVKEDRTGVFWDAEACPFPPCSTPDEIYEKIESALVERGFIDKLSIWVYLDDDNKKGTWRDVLLGGDKTWASRIYFLPGDQFTDDVEYTEMLKNLARGTCYILTVIPTQDINKPESDPEWPRLLIDGGGYRLRH